MHESEAKEREERTGLFDLLFRSQEVEYKYVPSQYIGTGTEVTKCYDSKVIEAIRRAIASASQLWKNNCPINTFIKKNTITSDKRRTGKIFTRSKEEKINI